MIIAYLITLFFLFEYGKTIIYILTNSTPKRFLIFYRLTSEIKNSKNFISFCIIGILLNILTLISIKPFSIYFFISITINIIIVKNLTNMVNNIP